MLRKILISFVIVLCLISSAYARPRVTVYDFTDESEQHDAPAGAIMHMMVTEVSKAGIFSLLERVNLEHIGREQKLITEGLIDPETAFELGKIKAARYEMTGAITMYYYHEKGAGIAIPIIGGATQKKTAYVLLEIRIFDNKTGEIVYAADELGTAKQEAKGAIAAYKGFFIGAYKRQYGGILATATREAVLKHVASLKSLQLEE